MRIKCKHCQKEFESINNAIYCSAKCRYDANKIIEQALTSQYRIYEEYHESKLDETLRMHGCENYAERQKAETLRLIKEGLL